jgi:WhiB family redox-sensing transcriptional regulator
MYAIYELPRLPPEPSPPAVSARLPRCADGNGTLTPLFFSDDVIDIARAKAICAKCPLTASCLSGALEREEPWGVWGGELLQNGRIVKNKRPCGRPPKVPRPELVVDELGVVGSVA